MTLHIFNPEHDIALASNLACFTAPHAGRQLRHDLGFLPALWAKPDDAVLVDDVACVHQLWKRRLRCPLVDKRMLSRLPVDGIEPWGWDLALLAFLRRHGIGNELLPTEAAIADVRRLSHRRVASSLLSRLRFEGTVGEAFECTDEIAVDACIRKYGSVVVKAPWSSSGRGLRFLKSLGDPHTDGWLRRVLGLQGSVMVEPFYPKVKDFGMEFAARADGRIDYLGLSLFHTQNGAYTGNVLATEQAKLSMMQPYVSPDLLGRVRDAICAGMSEYCRNRYAGPFGVDMMVVADDARSGFLLHPCVEINMRRTMGHVALHLSPHDDDIRKVMRIEYAQQNYQLTIVSHPKNL